MSKTLLRPARLRISTNEGVAEYLADLLRTGLYGNSLSKCSERLICDAIGERIDAGMIQARTFKLTDENGDPDGE